MLESTLGELPPAFLAAFTAERKAKPEPVPQAAWRPYKQLTQADLVAYVQANKPLSDEVARVLRGEPWARSGAKHDRMLAIVAALQDHFGPIIDSGHIFARSCEAARVDDPNTKASPAQWDQEFAAWWSRGEAIHAERSDALRFSQNLAASVGSNALVVAAAEAKQPFTKASLHALVKRAKDPNFAAILKAATTGQEIPSEFEPALEACGRWVAQKNPGIAPSEVMTQFAQLMCSTSGLESFRRGVESGHALSQDKDAWRRRLIVGENDKPTACVANAVTVLSLHPDTAGALAFDSRTRKFVFLRPVPWHRTPDPCLSNPDLANIGVWLTRTVGVSFATAIAEEAITALTPVVVNFDPVAQYLERCVWDGVSRLDTWLEKYAGVESSSYAQTVGRKTLLAAAKRALQPGCKVDTILVLEGAQGVKKSTLLKALCAQESWFAEHEGTLSGRDKDTVQAIACGPWIVELGELAGLRRTEVNSVKQFASRATDRFRPPYGRVTEDFPRKIIFVGSTNDTEYLQDLTGNRRWWPVRCGECDPTGLAAVRDLLWAEAVHAIKGGESWWLEGEIVAEAEAEQQARIEHDIWDEELGPWLEKQTKPVSMKDCLFAIGVSTTNANSREAGRIRGVLIRAGWVLGPKERRGDIVSRFWRKKGWGVDGMPTFEDAAKLIAEYTGQA